MTEPRKNNFMKIIALDNNLGHDQTVYLILLILTTLFYCNQQVQGAKNRACLILQRHNEEVLNEQNFMKLSSMHFYLIS